MSDDSDTSISIVLAGGVQIVHLRLAAIFRICVILEERREIARKNICIIERKAKNTQFCFNIGSLSDVKNESSARSKST